MKNKHGFTLIELIITMSIIGIMGTILYPSFSKIKTQAKMTSIRSTIQGIQLAIESYYMNQGQYPEGTQLCVADLITLLKETGEYTKIPTNPFTGRMYTAADTSGQIYYNLNSEDEVYLLYAYGAGNKEEIVRLQNI